MDLTGRRIVIVGGGQLACRKAQRLSDSGAHVSIVAPTLDPELQQLCREHHFTHLAQPLQSTDLDKVLLVFAASAEHDENLATARLAHECGCLVNVVNAPAHSSFLVPSLIDRSPLLIAVSSTGVSPVLARIIRARIDAFIPQSYRELGKLAERYRDRIVKRIPNWRERRSFWEQLLGGRAGDLILQGRTCSNDVALQKVLDKAVDSALEKHGSTKPAGCVYLVGAGPGDPDLLSFRALRLMQQCDVVLHDRLVSDAIMALVSPAAERVYVGKQRSDHAMPQESINEHLATLAKAGKRVLRLKGGDPFMFGRGGEEIQTLAAEGVDFQVVPGITAATGCASYAGIPLTHRDYAQACLFVTGHLKDGSVNLDWQALVRKHQTVVIYMGLVGLPVICSKLIEHGLSAQHPIALVAQGTRADQTVLTGTLESLPAAVSGADIKPPTLIIIGEVVRLREQLAWFEAQREPLTDDQQSNTMCAPETCHAET